MFIIIHYDEIGLKGGNRPFFERRLSSNISAKIGPAKIVKERGQIIAEYVGKEEDVISALSLTPGVSAFLIGESVPLDLELIQDKAVELMQDAKGTFKVNARRHNKKFPIGSQELNNIIGQKIKDRGLVVRLKNPETTLTIEICDRQAIISRKRYDGIAGLPVGTAEPMLCMISGGIDSPVAAFQMMKRGAKVDFVHFQNRTMCDSGVKAKISNLVSALARVQGRSRLFTVPFEDIQAEIISKINSKSRMIIYRRFMTRISAGIAMGYGIQALITGDSLSQVASQTVPNLASIRSAAELLTFSPLIGMNKNEIITIAKRIGTYPISILPYEDCCSYFISPHPETKAKHQAISRLEKSLDIDKLVRECIDKKILKELG